MRPGHTTASMWRSRQRCRLAILRDYLDEHCRVYQYLLKRTVAPFVPGTCDQPIANEAIQRRAAYLNGRCHDLYDLSLTAPFGIKTTEAPHYQRIVRQRDAARVKRGLPPEAVNRTRQLRAPRSVSDGNGFVFVDHLGNICPSGFLPAPRGNVRSADLGEVYRGDEMFRRLRHSDGLIGKCGRCQFRDVCGGSRARAFAATGAVMGSDPLCAYEPGPNVEAPVGRV